MAKDRTALATRTTSMKTESQALHDQLAEYSALRYDYSVVDPKHRRTLQDAAVDIRRKHRRVMEDTLAIGRRLNEVKDLLPHGEFSAWVEVEFEIAIRTAQRMMMTARAYPDEAQARRISVLGESAIYLLAAPSTPQLARDKIEHLIATTGKAPTVKEVEAIISEAKATTLTHLGSEIRALQGPTHTRKSDNVVAFDTPAIEANYTVVALEPTYPKQLDTPPDLAQRGLVIEEYERNYFRWRALSGGAEGQTGAGCDTADAAIRHARRCFEIIETYPAEMVERGIEEVKAKLVELPAMEAENEIDPEEAQAIAEVEAERTEEERLRIAMNFARDERLTFEQWWGMMPKGKMKLESWLTIFETAKAGARYLRDEEGLFTNAVNDVMPALSRLIFAIEKKVKS